jgi:hypothetical protein
VFDSSRWSINLFEPLEHLAESERRSDLAARMEERMRHRSVPGVLFVLLVLALVSLIFWGTLAI